MISSIIFMVIALVFGKHAKYHIKLTLMAAFTAITFIILPFIAKYGQKGGEWLLYSLVFINAACASYFEASIFGVGALLPFNYSIAIMLGCGVIGLLISIIMCNLSR